MKKTFIIWFISAGIWASLCCYQLISHHSLDIIILDGVAAAASLLAAVVHLKQYLKAKNSAEDTENK